MQKFAYNPQCWSPQRVHIQSVQVRVGLQRKKMHSREEEKNIYRFSASSFSPPYGFRLPCRTVDLSCRRLQHQLNREAGAAHFKVRNRLPGPGSCIKNNCNLVPSKKKEKKRKKRNKWWRPHSFVQLLVTKYCLKAARFIFWPFPPHLLASFP